MEPNGVATTDEVLAEVRAAKERLAQALDFDVGRILADARARQSQGGRVSVAPLPAAASAEPITP